MLLFKTPYTGMTRNRLVLYGSLFLLLYLLSVLLHLGRLELNGEEPRRAVISLEMLRYGNFLHPSLLGWDYYNKPPLFNWILCGSMVLTGTVSEFAVRLPSVIFYLLWAFCQYKISRRFLPEKTALLSTLFLLTSIDLYFYGIANGGEIDIFYSFVVYVQATALFLGWTRKRWLLLFAASYFLCAVGFLTKGFPSLVFQALTLLALCIQARSVRFLFRWQHLAGLLLFAAVIGLYLFWYSQYIPPQRLLVNLVNESLIKSAIGERANLLLQKSIGYPLLFLKLLLPWSLLLLLLLKRTGFRLTQNAFVYFSLLFIVCNIGVYWFTGQPKGRYVYMFLPFATTILAAIYEQFTTRYPTESRRIIRGAGFVFVLVAAAVAAAPFVTDVSPGWTLVLLAAMLLFLWLFFRAEKGHIWLFITGLVLARLVYAALFIPVEYEEKYRFGDAVREMAQRTGNKPLYFYAPVRHQPIALQTKLFSYSLEQVASPPVLSYQIPYYYRTYTGHLIQYDTTLYPNRTYLSFASDLQQLPQAPLDTLYVFENKKQEEVIVVYRLTSGDKN